MTEGDAQQAAQAILHVFEMFCVDLAFDDEEFRYRCAEEVRVCGAEDAGLMADAVCAEIDRQHPNKNHPI